MTTQVRAQIDKFLTNVSNKIVNTGYISEMILPSLSVAQYSGKIAAYGNDHLRIVNTISGGKNGYPMIESDVRSSATYDIEEHALKGILTDRDYKNVEKPFDAERDMVAKLTSHLWLGKEKALADALTDPAIITNNFTPTNKYDDYSLSTPLEDVVTGRESIYDSIGKDANTIVVDWKTHRRLRYHPQLLDSLGYKNNRPGGLSVEEMARAFDVERYIIGSAVYNSAKQGQADAIAPVWGDNMILMHSPTNAALDQVSLGYRVQIAGRGPRQVYKFAQEEPINSMKIIVKDDYDQLLTNTGAAYLIQDTLS